jgi:Zn-finger nucleic acid-binding protein
VSDCQKCGAPITLRLDAPVVCTFCGTQNAPAPKEVKVPVAVQVVHNVVHVSTDGVRECRCPHCKKKLVGVRVEDVELDGCPGCGGIWVANESAQKVVAEPKKIFSELAARAAQNARGRFVRAERVACPVCDASLDPTKVHGIELDCCADHGTWFDRNELVRLTAALRGERVPELGVDVAGGKTVCAECKQPLDAARANIGEYGPTCEACWRGRTQQLIATQDAETQKNGAITAAGLVLGLGAAILGAAASKD